MNILHMKYALEVAKAGSLNKASETLLIAVPNLSRSIKELESNLGILIFERTNKGMCLTPDGEQFIDFAKDILDQIDQVERFYKEGNAKKKYFSIAVPRACYISDAFVKFSNSLSTNSCEIYYKETDSRSIINHVINKDFNLGIIRYAVKYDEYFKKLLDEKALNYEMIGEFSYSLLMSRDNPLAEKNEINIDDLTNLIEITHADYYVPSIQLTKLKKEEFNENIKRKIFVYERASQFELLSENPQTFMWVSPIPKKTIDRYSLVNKMCSENKKVYKDLLIFQKDYRLTKIDKKFITDLCDSKRQIFSSFFEKKEAKKL